MNNKLVILKNGNEPIFERDATLVDAQGLKRAALMVAQSFARAEAELNRRAPSRSNNQDEPPFAVILSLLASACKRMSPKAQLETRASNVWQEGMVPTPGVSEVKLNRLGFALRGKLVLPPRACVVQGADWTICGA